MTAFVPDPGIRRLDLTTFPFPLLGRADEAIKCLLLARTCRSGMSAHRSLSGDKRTTYAKRRETGEESRVQVPCDEEIAIHIGPQSHAQWPARAAAKR